MLDRRLNAYRPDLADSRLKGLVEAARFTEGEPARIIEPVVDLRRQPDPLTGIDTQLLFGETVRVLDRMEGWAWIVADRDGYVGYLSEQALSPQMPAATHIVAAPRSFAYLAADMKSPVVRPLSLGSRLAVTGIASTRGSDYLRLDDGTFVMALHARPIANHDGDPVALAARLVETPYLWGGASAFGLDCSGLVQLCLAMTGRPAPRDSDLQAAGLGSVISDGDRQRGDLVFWKGHVAMIEDRDTVIHANGHTMSVARESLANAIDRIRPVYGEPTVWRRP